MLEDIKDDEYGIHSVDFNKIIPMPPGLDLEAGSCTQAGLDAYRDFIDVYTLGGTINTEHLSDIPVGRIQLVLVAVFLAGWHVTALLRLRSMFHQHRLVVVLYCL